METKDAIAGINPKTSVCDAVALATDSDGRREMMDQGLLIVEVSQASAKQMLGEKVELPYAFAG